MNNDLMEHIRRLNALEKERHELKKKFALNRIKELRQRQKEQENVRNVIPQ